MRSLSLPSKYAVSKLGFVNISQSLEKTVKKREAKTIVTKKFEYKVKATPYEYTITDLKQIQAHHHHKLTTAFF